MADIENDIKCTRDGCGHPASMHGDTDEGKNTGACTAQGCDCSAMQAAMTAGAVGPHSTATSDGSWDGPANEKSLGDSPTDAQLKAAYAWVPDSADDLSKSNCKFIHHEIGSDGTVGAANETACSTGIGVLNGGRSGTTIPDSDVQGVYDHLHKHLTDAGRKPDDIPELEAAATRTERLAVGSDGTTGASATSADDVIKALAEAQSAVGSVDSPPAWLAQAGDLLDAAGAAAAGLSADDENESARWAQAMDAAVDAAITVCPDGSDTGDSADAVTAIKAADQVIDAYLKANGIEDPDENYDDGDEDDDTNSDDGGDAVTAAGEEGDAADMQPWEIPVLVIEGNDTGDGRFIQAESLTPGDLPQTLMALTENSDFGHNGAFPVGRIDTLERYDASSLTCPRTGEPYGEGTFAWKANGVFTSAVSADEVITMVREKVLKGVSADLREVESILELLSEDGTVEVSDVNPENTSEDDFWEALDKGLIRETVTKGRIMGATVCPFPAFEGAYIVIGDVATEITAAGSSRVSLRIHDHYGVRTCAACEEGNMTAAAAPMEPPSSWFNDPGLGTLTPLTVTEDGRVFGHIAAWGTCHTGVSGRCVTPPRSKSGYSYFRTGAVRTDEGDLVSVGQLTLGTGHAALNLDSRTAVEHYDHTGTAIADVAAGEDRFGIWVSGSLRPDATDLQIRQLRASAISGDWRNVGGRLELVGALCVNVPGFPVVRGMVASSGAQVSLVAAGGRPVITAAQDTLADLIEFKQMAEPVLREFQVDQLRRRVHVRY